MVLPPDHGPTKAPDGGANVWSARIYLARHGRTTLNAAGALRGHIDVPLDSVGHHQASLLGAELAGRNPGVIISSPLRRALETAAPLAQRTSLVTVIDKRLTDRHYGEWAGVRSSDVVARWGSLDAAPGVEPADEVRDRVLAALIDVAESAGGTAAVVVSHDAVNRIALSALDPSLGAPDALAQETGCFNTLECHKQANGQLGWSVLSINQVPQGEVFTFGPELVVLGLRKGLVTG